MKLKVRFIICICLLPGSLMLFSQGKPSRQSSTDAFTKGNYEVAYIQFSKLLETYPKDPLYKYYSAACLVELKRDIPKAESMLEQALASGSMRSLPNESLFYMGRARQYLGKYREAEKAYNRFTEEAGRKMAKEMNVPEYIRQCRENTGRLAESALASASVAAPVKAGDPITQPPVERKTDTLPVSKQTLPANVDSKLGNILENQYRADSVNAASASSKAPARTLQDTVKPLGTKPVVSPPDTARKIKSPQPENARPLVQPENNSLPVKNSDTIKIRTISSTGTILSVFEILPKAATDPKEKIVINPEQAQGLVYRIQVAVFRNPVSLAYFKGLSPVYGFKAPGSSVTTYYIGVFRRIADATQARSSVRSRGFKDAFVIAQMDGKTVSMERAAMLEKEWGDRSLFSFGKPEQEEALDTLPPTLVFRVEVARSPKPLKEEVVDDLKKVAGNRTFDVQPMSDNTIAYLIGDFITFQSANEYTNLLIKNGYRDSKVVAWLGKKQIDVDTARKLFESLK